MRSSPVSSRESTMGLAISGNRRFGHESWTPVFTAFGAAIHSPFRRDAAESAVNQGQRSKGQQAALRRRGAPLASDTKPFPRSGNLPPGLAEAAECARRNAAAFVKCSVCREAFPPPGTQHWLASTCADSPAM